jgi:hypothetical protein
VDRKRIAPEGNIEALYLAGQHWRAPECSLPADRLPNGRGSRGALGCGVGCRVTNRTVWDCNGRNEEVSNGESSRGAYDRGVAWSRQNGNGSKGEVITGINRRGI